MDAILEFIGVCPDGFEYLDYLVRFLVFLYGLSIVRSVISSLLSDMLRLGR